MSDSKIAYIVSCYPATSHTFIHQEIDYLRKSGKNIVIASINPSNIEEAAKDIEVKSEEKKTFYIKQQGFIAAIDAAFHFIFTRPFQFFQAIGFTWKYIRQAHRGIKYFFGYFGEALLFARWLNQHEVGQVHAYFGNAAATVALVAKRLQPFTFSLSIHGADVFYDETIEGLAVKLKDADWIRCISFYSKSQILKHLPFEQWQKLHLIHMGIDIHKINTDRFSGKSLQSSKRIIVSVGRLVASKGHAILIQAIASLKKQGTLFEVDIVGSGPERGALEELAMKLDVVDEIRFKGALSHPNTIELISTADAFVLASFAEGVPIVLMEAMALKIPCVSTWINGTPELITNGVDGLLVAPSDVDGLQAAIVKIMEDHDLRSKITSSARQTIETSYDLEKNTQKLSRLF